MIFLGEAKEGQLQCLELVRNSEAEAFRRMEPIVHAVCTHSRGAIGPRFM